MRGPETTTGAFPSGIGVVKQGAQGPLDGAAPGPIRASAALPPGYHWAGRSETVHRKVRVRNRIASKEEVQNCGAGWWRNTREQ